MITRSSDCPEIKFEKNGHLSIRGNSTGVKPERSFKPVIQWIRSYKGKKLKIDIDLDFVNCSSVRMLSRAIIAAELNHYIKKKYINWHYHNSEQEELGEIISSVVRSSMFKLTNKD
jgi:hypothetical protein